MTDIQYLEFTEKLLSLQSHNPQSSQVPNFIYDTLTSFGCNPYYIESNGIKNVICQTNGAIKTILNGHWDTVLPSQSFNKDVLTVTTEKNSLIGLGACDMKSGVAAMTAAFIDCHSSNINGLALCLVGDEEKGGQNGTKVTINKGIIGQYIILGEPTNLKVSLGQKGGLFVTARASGISGHSAYPNRGDNAILKINRFINSITNLFPLPDKQVSTEDLFIMTTASINQISGGSSPNVIPDSSEVKIDMRIPPEVSELDIISQIQSLAIQSNVNIQTNFLGNGWQLDKGSNLFKVTSEVLTKVLKSEPEYIKKMGSNDGKYYASKGCQIINIGPGDSTLSHTPNERIFIEQLHIARTIYTNIVRSLYKSYN